MDIARSVAALLTWQWLILILALIFRRPLHELFRRIVRIGIGGPKGAEIFAPLPEPDIGRVIEVGEPKIQDRIDAKLIVLRDSEGRERAKLGVTDKDAVAFTMSGPNGNEHLHLNETSIYFVQDSGEVQACL